MAIFYPLAQKHTVLSRWKEALMAVLFQIHHHKTVAMNTRMGKQVTWLDTTASSTTPADNVFLHLWLFLCIHRIYAMCFCALIESDISKPMESVILSLSFAIRSAFLLLKADSIPTCSYTGQNWDLQVFRICSVCNNRCLIFTRTVFFALILHLFSIGNWITLYLQCVQWR